MTARSSFMLRRGLLVGCLAMVLIAGIGTSGAVPPRRANASSQFVQKPAGNGLVAFVSKRTGNAEIFTMAIDGSGQTNLTNNTRADIDPAWSPDGTRIAFTSNRTGNNEIFVMNANGTGAVDLTNKTTLDSQPAWSPDGAKIAFTTKRGGNNEIFVMNADGSGQTNLTNNTAADSDPAWSPDGAKIAFTTKRGGNNEVYVMNADGSGQTNLTNNTAGDSQPAWSPDGAKIAFTSTRAGNSEIFVMNADGTGQTDLSNDASADSEATWSPDQGTRLLFTSKRTGDNEIDVMNFDGKNPFDVSNNAGSDVSATWQPLTASPAAGWPIQHVVIMYQENHSFDNVLGLFCAQLARCNGATSGQLHDGTVIPLSTASDIVAPVRHDGQSQLQAINGGAMNGFDLIQGCEASTNHACYSQYNQTQIPNLWDLASTFAVSDATYELDTIPSWHAHLELAASQLDGFAIAENPDGPKAPGWGCDTHDLAKWAPTVFAPITSQPSCVPDKTGSGPFTTSQVPWVNTIMNRMDAAGVPWSIYAPGKQDTFGYGWQICPTFADCVFTGQASNVVSASQFAIAAAAGNLPAVSMLIPDYPHSQHNNVSMLGGDNWIADNVNAVMSGPDWASTAIFLTWDDCGCFYDHVLPAPGLGIRVPMVIISPFAKPASTDSTTASFASLLAFIEHDFGLAPLSQKDAGAYDFTNAFNFTQRPLSPITLTQHPLPKWEQDYLAAHPPDEADPT